MKRKVGSGNVNGNEMKRWNVKSGKWEVQVKAEVKVKVKVKMKVKVNVKARFESPHSSWVAAGAAGGCG